MKTLNQERAAYALEKVLVITAEGFKSFSAGAAPLILQNGLGQMMAFWAHKGKDSQNSKHMIMLTIIREWLNKKDILKSTDLISFIKNISSCEQNVYLKAQKESLALIDWIKRYSGAFLK